MTKEHTESDDASNAATPAPDSDEQPPPSSDTNDSRTDTSTNSDPDAATATSDVAAADTATANDNSEVDAAEDEDAARSTAGSDHDDNHDNPDDSPVTTGSLNIPDSAGAGESGRDRSRASSELDIDSVLDHDTTDEDDSEGLFDDLLSGEPIFENKEVLRPSYTPHELPHRNDQINQMATILVSALRGDTPSNILIYGKTGTGKTASAKFVSQELESTSEKYDVPCEVEYINCEVTDTQYRVLAQLANKFIEKNVALIESRIETLESVRDELAADSTADADEADDDDADETDEAEGSPIQRTDAETTESVALSDVESDPVPIPDAEGDTPDDSPEGSLPVAKASYDSVEAVAERIESLRADADEMEPVPMTGWPTDRVYNTFFEAVDYNERVVVIMLDEIDKLVEKSGDDTLYNLSRMNNELTNSRISIMGISNDLKFTDFLDPRVKSSLGEEEIVFPPYDATQLRDILQHRADVAFKPDALTSDVIPLCAAFAAQEHGDARRALDLLRTAGELAERSQADIVEEEHVRQAQDKIELDRVVEVVRTLPTQSKIVLFSIILLEQNGVHNINTGEVFNIYKRLCEEIDADVLTQRRVTDLISELDMLGIVNAVVVSKGRYGRTKEMSLSVPLDETEAVLLSDSRLGDIDDVQPFVQARFDN